MNNIRDLVEKYALLCQELESSQDLNTRDIGHEIDIALQVVEFSLDKISRSPCEEEVEALTSFVADIDLWGFLESLFPDAQREGFDVADERVEAAFLLQRRIRKEFYSIIESHKMS